MLFLQSRRRLAGTIALGCLISVLSGTGKAGEIEGFTEPYRDIDVAAADSGIVEQIAVAEGEAVTEGQSLGQLNLDVLKATLEIADQTRKSEGRLKSAQAELRLKQERLAKLKMLLERKSASQEEVERTAVELEVAEAQVLAVQEELAIRQLEHMRIEKQIEMRLFRSPINGVVTRVFKDQGEFVSPTDAVVLNVVQLDPLLCVFSVPSVLGRTLKAESTVQLQVSDAKLSQSGTVEFVSPVTDAQSGTIQIKVRLPNPERKFRSGDKCYLVVDGPVPTEQKAQAPPATSTRSAFRSPQEQR